jgi:hypothetical protein
MGVVYGAGSMWQWRLHPGEPEHAPFFLAEGAGWREALDFEGSQYVGLVSRILEGLPIADIEPNWQVTLGRRGLLIPKTLYIGYSEQGGPMMIQSDQVPLHYRVVDPRTGAIVREGTRSSASEAIPDEGGGPRVFICYDQLSEVSSQ